MYRDQRFGTDGKEVCDLFVVFGNHIFIFSDKNCEFPNTDDLAKDWARWFRRAVLKSAHQVWGAERWLREHPNRLFLDKACTKPFPVTLPHSDNAIYHRIVVAHGSAARCKARLGGSGSLMIRPQLVDQDHHDLNRPLFSPFAVGRLSASKGFVHVIDDFSLDVLLKTLDTAPDLARYLEQRTLLIESGRLVAAAGEEELLAYYLQHVNSQGEHYFHVPPGTDTIVIGEGLWNSFSVHPQRLAQIQADTISYAWDKLIDKFTHHLLEGTQYAYSDPSISHQEIGFRLLARERRTRRRMLGKSLIGLIKRGAEQDKVARVVLPSFPGDPHYIFLSLKPRPGRSYEEYRTVRRNLLEGYCLVTRLKFPNALHVIGIATEPISYDGGRSEDLIYLDGTTWDDELAAEAAQYQKDFGLLEGTKRWETTESEFPEPGNPQIKKGRNRNQACPCGSGKKYKKCCGCVAGKI